MPYVDPNIKAEVICHSVNQHGDELVTFVITYPRIILAEINTHRMISKSTASSRAIPIKKQIEKVGKNCFYPSWWGAWQKGMQANEELRGNYQKAAVDEWEEASRYAMHYAAKLDLYGVHKQIANRLLEPFSYCTSILTGTEWANFFNLRAHKDAQPEFMVLAFKMLEALVDSTPISRDQHVPFGDQMEPGLTEDERMRIACARCARISYENFSGNRDSKNDLRLSEQLIESGHMSPFEHVATTFPQSVYIGNFKGWVQYRKKIPKENINKVDYKKLLKEKPNWV